MRKDARLTDTKRYESRRLGGLLPERCRWETPYRTEASVSGALRRCDGTDILDREHDSQSVTTPITIHRFGTLRYRRV